MKLDVHPRRAVGLALALCAGMLVACLPLSIYRITRFDIPHKSGKLANGLRVAVQPDQSVPKVTVVVRYDVGGAHDPSGKEGLAHLVEHLAHRVGEELIETKAGATELSHPDSGDTTHKTKA